MPENTSYLKMGQLVSPTLIITAAGMSSRFHALGYEKPKYLLPWKTRNSVLYEIVSALINDLGASKTLILINSREKYHFPEIKSCFDSFPSISIEMIPDTRGQAHTASIGCDLLSTAALDQPLIVHNSDTLLMNRVASSYPVLRGVDVAGCVDTFFSTSPNYSYVRANDEHVSGFSEKTQDSIFASSGMVVFTSGHYYRQLYKSYHDSFAEDGEEYLSSIVNNDIISNDRNYVHVHSKAIEDTVVLGTPAEYCEAFTKASINDGI
jgi:choline kinase